MSRLVGILNLVAGLGFIAVGVLLVVSGSLEWDLKAAAVVCVFAGVGGGLMWMGMRFFKYDSDTLPATLHPSRFDHAVVRYRRQLTVLAEVCCGLAVVDLIAVCVSAGWRTRDPAFLPLAIGCIVLLYVARRSGSRVPTPGHDWIRVAKPIRTVLERANQLWNILFIGWALLYGLGVVLGFRNDAYRFTAHIITAGWIALLFGLEALFFRYGETGAGTSPAAAG